MAYLPILKKEPESQDGIPVPGTAFRETLYLRLDI
jgi:hypothetical protein